MTIANTLYGGCFLLALMLYSANVRALPANGSEEIWKYILLWSPVAALGERRDRFISNNCSHQSCFVTADRRYFKQLTDFDAVVFNVKHLATIEEFPARRHPRQRYIFAAAESARNYPACGARWDGFFNWTWTYRLDSDVRWTYLEARDAAGRAAAPRERPRWLAASDPVSAELADSLRTKTKAAAWFVPRRNTWPRAEAYIRELGQELRKFNLSVDVFSGDGPRRCPGGRREGCRELIRRDYHFYLSFEASEDKDLVTGKLLTALRSDAVPVVRGGADYSRFLPPGSYLNSKQLTTAQLAAAIAAAVGDPVVYRSYFRWRNHYTYERALTSRSVCELCARLNDDQLKHRRSTVRELSRWWSGGDCPPPPPAPEYRRHYMRLGSAFFNW